MMNKNAKISYKLKAVSFFFETAFVNLVLLV